MADIKRVSICVNSSALDQVYAAFIMAAAATTMADRVDMCVAMGGVHTFIKGQMDKLKVSADLASMGDEFKQRIEKTNYTSLKELLSQAKESGIFKIHCCQPSIDLFGYTNNDLIDEVDDIIGSAAALDIVADADVSLSY